MRAFDSSRPHSESPAIWLGDAPALADDDPMAQVLPWLVQHLGMGEALAAGTGLDDAASRERPGQLLGALQQLGFDTRLNHGPVTALHAGDLPAVLRLRTGDACVLVALQDVPGGLRRCQVVVLAPEPMAFTVTDADLARECAGPALLIRRPAARPAVRAEPARGSSALAQALAERRAAQRAAAAPTMPAMPNLPAAAAPPLPMAAPAPRAAAAPARASAPDLPGRAPLSNLPTLDDVIEADELADLMARAAQPMLADALDAARRAQAVDADAMPDAAAIRPAPARDAAAPPPWAHTQPPAPLPPRPPLQVVRETPPVRLHEPPPPLSPQASTLPASAPRPQPQAMAASLPPPSPRPPVPDLSLDDGPPTPAVPAAAPAADAVRVAAVAPDSLAPDLRRAPLPAAGDARASDARPPAAAPPDAGADMVLDLGFLDRQTGAGRLRGQLGRWRHQLRSQWQAMAGDGPLPGAARVARWVQSSRPPQRGGEPALAFALSPSRRPPDAAAPAAAAAAGDAPVATFGAPAAAPSPPGRAAGGAWRPRFGLAWPLGQAPTVTPAANAGATAAHERREPTLEPAWPAADAPPTVHAAMHHTAARPGRVAETPTWPAELAWADEADAPRRAMATTTDPRRATAGPPGPRRASAPPPGAHRPGRPALDPDLMYVPLAHATGHAMTGPAGRQDRLANASGLAGRRTGRTGWTAALRARLSSWRQHASRRPVDPPADRVAAPAGPQARAAVRWRSGLPWPGLRQSLQRWRPSLPAAGALARRLLHGLAQHSGLARTAAALRRWPARVAAAPWARWLEAPLWAACGSVCLIDGLPLAWARMVSASGLRAAAGVLPGLLREALAADEDRAAAALAAAATAGMSQARRGPVGGPRRAAPGVPPAANAAQLAAQPSGAVAPAAATPQAGAVPALPAVFTGPSTLAMVAARADKVERARIRGIDVATTLRRRSEAQSMGPPPPPRVRRAPLRDPGLLAA